MADRAAAIHHPADLASPRRIGAHLSFAKLALFRSQSAFTLPSERSIAPGGAVDPSPVRWLIAALHLPSGRTRWKALVPPTGVATLLRVAESAVPILPSRNLDETFEFYSRLGFQLQGAPIEKYRYLIIGRGSIELHFWDAPDVDPLTTDASCYIRVEDTDALHREWKEVGIQSDPATGSRLMPPVDTDYGMREFALVDQSGNLVRVGSPLRTAAD